MTSQERLKSWLEYPNLDKNIRAEIEKIKNDPNEVEACFGGELEFGTGGLRGILRPGINGMNIYTVMRATAGFAAYLSASNSDTAKQGVVISHDNRRMSREFAVATAGVFAAAGIKAYIFDSLRPTPELSFAVRYKKAAGGVMITASHNPPEYNGYKIYDAEGCQLGLKGSGKVIEQIRNIKSELDIPCLSLDEAGELISVLGYDVDEAYYSAVKSISLHSVNAGKLCVVYSPQHGAGNVPVRRVLSDMGYDLHPVLEQCTPDPDFSATKNPNPELAEAYEAAMSLAEKTNADIVITTDPDCDRLGVAARDSKKGGALTLMTGNQSGAVLIEYILSTHRANGTMPQRPVMINTIVTSDLGDKICESYGVKVEKTLTGFKFIGDKIASHIKNNDGGYVFGYEESYGCLIDPFVRDKDGVQASFMLCEAAAYYKSHGKTLIDVLDVLYERFGFYLDAQSNLYFKGADGQAKIAAITSELRKNSPCEASGIKVLRVEDYLSDEMQAMGFPASDVLRYILADGSWVAVRPSGTEPKCKFYYCVKAADKASAEEKLSAFKKAFEPNN